MSQMVKRNKKGQFKKGITPWNKGKNYTLENHINKTTFKNAEKHPRYRPIGSEREDKDGYIVIKIADRKWMTKHRYMWEQGNGPVPTNHVIIFANGNKRDFNIDNLICVSRKQLAIINKNNLITNDSELTKTGVVIADLLLSIGEAEKENDKE